MIELRSDTFTLPSPAMLAAIAEAPLGNDGYGTDPTVLELESLTAEMLGKQRACLVPSGTMANLLSIMTHAPRGSAVLVGDESDVYVYEAGGASVCGGVMYQPVPNRPDGRIDLADVAAALPPEPDDSQFARPRLLCLENTHNRCGGAVLPPAYLAEVADFGRAHGLAVHLDGARLFNAAVALDVAPAEIAAHADSVQCCLSKGLGAPIGSVVAGGVEFVEQVRWTRKMLGGGMRQAGIIAAPGIVGLRGYRELAADHRKAARLARGLARLPGIALDPTTVVTNIVIFEVPGLGPDELLAVTSARGLALSWLGGSRFRAVLHRDVDEADVDEAVAILADVLARAVRATA